MLLKQPRGSGWWLIAGGIFLLLAGLTVIAWQNMGRVASLYLERGYNQSGIKLSYEDSHYNPWRGQLVLTGARLTLGEGLTINARNMELSPSWFSLVLDGFQLSQIEFHHSEITVHREQLKAQKQPWVIFNGMESADLLFNSATIRWLSDNEKNNACYPSCSIKVQKLALKGVNKEQAEVVATGQLQGADWQFNGKLAGESQTLDGVLDIENLSLNSFGSWYQKSAKVALAGYFDGRFNLHWQAGSAMEMKGTGHTGEGGMIDKELSVNWDSVELKDITYSSDSNRWQVDKLFFEKPTIKTGSRVMQPLALILRLSETVGINSAIFKDAELNTEALWGVNASELSVLFQGKALSYTLNGKLQKGETIQMDGSFSGAEEFATHRYQLTLGAAVAGQGVIPAFVGSYDLTGTRVRLSFNGTETLDSFQGDGSLTLQGLSSGVFKNNEGVHRLTLALLTDSRGIIQTSFAIKKTKKDVAPSKDMLAQAINAHWKVVAAKPFVYLSRIKEVSSKISPQVTFAEGKSVLEEDSVKNLQTLTIALKERPGLAIAVEGHASRQLDWPALSALELEDALHELYGVMNKAAAGHPDQAIPDAIRNNLIEQMYLRTQKRKMPEISSQSEAQRVAVAERWLLENWPYGGESLDKLADSRSRVIINRLQDGGITPERIKKLPSKVSESRSLSKIVLEAL